MGDIIVSIADHISSYCNHVTVVTVPLIIGADSL